MKAERTTLEPGTGFRRLFFALPVPAEIGNALLRAVPHSLGVRSVETAADLHLTLKFLGNTAVSVSRLLESATQAIEAREGADGTPPRLVATGVNVFLDSSGDQCRIFWGDLPAGEQGNEARDWLARLAAAIAEAVEQDLPARNREEPFVPHVTLAREGKRVVSAAEGRQWMDEWQAVVFGSWQPDSVALYETIPAADLSPGSARFRVVGMIPLQVHR